jgi:hypothetical protein
VAREHQNSVTRQELVVELDKIYRGIREIDPKKYSWGTWGKSFDFTYLTMTDWPGMYDWWCQVIKEHPLESVEYGALGRNKDGLPEIPVTTTLHDGIRFSKPFVFTYLAQQQRWQARWGLDLHLDPQWKDLPRARQKTLR